MGRWSCACSVTDLSFIGGLGLAAFYDLGTPCTRNPAVSISSR